MSNEGDKHEYLSPANDAMALSKRLRSRAAWGPLGLGFIACLFAWQAGLEVVSFSSWSIVGFLVLVTYREVVLLRAEQAHMAALWMRLQGGRFTD
jgi:hypothetical protein